MDVRVPRDCPVVVTTEFDEPRMRLARGLARGVDRAPIEFRRVSVTSEEADMDDPERCLCLSFEGLPLAARVRGTAVRLEIVESEELEEEADGAGEGKRGGATAGVWDAFSARARA